MSDNESLPLPDLYDYNDLQGDFCYLDGIVDNNVLESFDMSTSFFDDSFHGQEAAYLEASDVGYNDSNYEGLPITAENHSAKTTPFLAENQNSVSGAFSRT